MQRNINFQTALPRKERKVQMGKTVSLIQSFTQVEPCFVFNELNICRIERSSSNASTAAAELAEQVKAIEQ